MSKIIENIKKLIDSLPVKDIPLGYKFLDRRDFDSLSELIGSALYKINKNLNSDSPKEEYLKLNLENINKLKSEVDLYVIESEILESNFYNNEEDENNSEYDENYY